MRNCDCEYIWQYIDDIKANRIEHCKDIELMIDNIVIPVLQRDDVIVDNDKIEKGLALQKYFDFQLVEFELFLFALIVGVFLIKDGYRECFFNEIDIIIGRGSGKNGFISFLCFYFLSPVHGIKKYDIEIIANAESQAMTSFNDVYDVITYPDKSNAAAIHYNFYATKTVITGTKTNSKLRFNSSSKKGKDSKRTGCVIKDEYHEFESTENIDTLTSGLGKVADARNITITSDGLVRGKAMDKLKDRCRDILKEYNPENRTLVYYCHIEEESEWNQEDKWVKAIPSINEPAFRSLKERIKAEVLNMPYTPEYYKTFCAKRLDFPVGDNEIEVASWDDIIACNKELPDLTGCSCIGCIDYTKTNDFVGVGLLFKQKSEFYFMHHTFVCTKSKDLIGIKAPLKQWEADGLLTFINDVEITPDIISNWFLEKMMQGYDIKKIALDSFRYSILSKALGTIGFCGENGNIKLVRPSDLMRCAPIINSAFLNHNLYWGIAPIMNWYTNNVKKVIDKKGNTLFEKIEPLYRKTDGFMAMAAGFTLVNELEDETADYDIAEPIIFGG